MSDKTEHHDLFDFMSQISQEMDSEYYRIQKRAKEDPGTAGDQGEENWASLLRDWLPSTYQVVTKGRIIGHDGKASPQVDILVLKSSYPRKLLDKKLYLAGGIAAAFECKVTLKAEHITKSIENCITVKSLFRSREGSPYKELHAPIVYGILSHSHSWKNDNSKPLENINNKLIREDERLVNHPRQMIDTICVADLATWIPFKNTFIGRYQLPDYDVKFAKTYGVSGSAATAYIAYTKLFQNQASHFTPIGTLLFHLLKQMAWENKESRSMADYFRMTHIQGSGGGALRKWTSNIYSVAIRSKVEGGKLTNGIMWDEWSISF